MYCAQLAHNNTMSENVVCDAENFVIAPAYLTRLESENAFVLIQTENEIALKVRAN